MKKSRETKDRSKPDDEVKVHVTYFGGLYVKPGELLRSKAAQETIKRVDEVFRTQPLDARESGKPQRAD